MSLKTYGAGRGVRWEQGPDGGTGGGPDGAGGNPDGRGSEMVQGVPIWYPIPNLVPHPPSITPIKIGGTPTLMSHQSEILQSLIFLVLMMRMTVLSVVT